ncbi:MAG TPA: Mpo1-like protein [Usitatibacter sp.]|nr:Mpo1-like protein [Usitatibacter sp.]
MKSIAENLTQYAAYHRDRRNIATHFVGVPMIVFSIVLALATVTLAGGSTGNAFGITLAAVVCIAATLYYLKLDLALGIAMGIVLFLMCAGASEMTHRLGVGWSLAWALGIFVVGWAIQFVGHKYEGVKPAFFDDAKQLLIGPVFVCAEGCFLLGARADLRRYIEDRVGPTVPRRDGRPIPILDGEPRF